MATHRHPAAPAVICIGSAALDILMTVDDHPGPDDRVPATDGLIAGGGPAATAAVALARLGVDVALVARVADDLAGRLIREQLGDEGVDIRWLVQGGEDARSALASALIGQGPPSTRSLAALSAHPPLTVDAMTPAALEACRRVRWLHVDHAGWPLVAGLRASGVHTPVSVDGGNPLPDLDLALVDLYAPSMRELHRWTGAHDDDAALSRALGAGARAVIATLGEAGATCASTIDPDTPWPDDSPAARPAPSASRWRLDMPAHPIDAYSTLGAGDVYHGALLAALVGGATIRGAMAEASVAAALSCRGLDGRSAIPDRTELRAALDAWSPAPTPIRRSDA